MRSPPWMCPDDNCMAVNKALSQKCYMCGEPKPDDVPQPDVTVPMFSEEAMREEWRANGGSIHGPNVETVTMTEADYFRFRLKLESRK